MDVSPCSAWQKWSARRGCRPAPHTWASTALAYKRIGALELLAALGLLIGLVEAWIGLAAAVGLVFLMTGACITHLRNGDGPREIAPAVAMTAGLVSYLVLVRRQ